MAEPRLAVDDRLNAFCKDSDAYLEGAPNGALSGLSFAAKDIFDVAGHVTGGGNPDWKATHDPAASTAWAVRVLVEAGATLVGKTLTDELTRGITGENVHYGTPLNPQAPGRIPGGSSCGSASAVAGGLVDFALGSDTLGSVRVPASYCGLYGLRPTHGRIPLDGVLQQAPSYDTVGWFTRDADLFARVGAALFQSDIINARPSRVVFAEDAFEPADDSVAVALQPAVDAVASLVHDTARVRLSHTPLTEWYQQQLVLQSREAWNSVKDWVDRVNPRMSFLVAKRYVFAGEISDQDVETAVSARRAIVERMNQILIGGTVVCLPTTPTPARPLRERLSDLPVVQRPTYSLVTIASTIGAPQISMPLGQVGGLPVGLSLIGARGSDEMLLAFAREVAKGGR